MQGRRSKEQTFYIFSKKSSSKKEGKQNWLFKAQRFRFLVI